jgi:hypothetical protein
LPTHQKGGVMSIKDGLHGVIKLLVAKLKVDLKTKSIAMQLRSP